MSIHPGYMGSALIGANTRFRFADANIAAKQDIQAPDMVAGDWNPDAYTFGKVEINGSISGPATDGFASGASSVFNWAAVRDACGGLTAQDVLLTYFCGSGYGTGPTGFGGRKFPNMLVNSLNFSCAAGDIANFSLDLVGATAPIDQSQSSGASNTTVEKLITWDKVSVSIVSGGIAVPIDALLSNFEFTINNNVTPVYAMNQATNTGFFPEALIPGIRRITGSISCYDPQAFNGVIGYNTPAWDADSGRSTITFNLGATTVSFKVQFHRVEPALGVGPIIGTVQFTAVGNQPFN